MNCPRKKCGLPVWEYDEHTLTCKAGHQTRKAGYVEPSRPRRLPQWLVPVAVALPGVVALILELLP